MSRASLGFYSFAILAASGVISSALARDGSPDLVAFFSGHLSAAGTFQNHFDGSTRGVRIDVHGVRSPRGFKLIEDTVYSDGEKHRSLWTLSKVAEGQYVGEGTDLIGLAKIQAQGNEIDIAYRAHVATKDGKIHDLDFKQTYIFNRPGTADYRVTVSFLFVPIGDAYMTIRKLRY
jgi:hypothetical protein